MDLLALTAWIALNVLDYLQSLTSFANLVLAKIFLSLKYVCLVDLTKIFGMRALIGVISWSLLETSLAESHLFWRV